LTYRPPVQLRHSFATLALADGVPLEWISKQMGHDDVSITAKRYAAWLPKGDERWMHHLDAAWASSTGRESDGEAATQ
jgi:integrase